MKTVLFIAMHFPPYATGSGYLRTLKFCEYLPRFGWQPVVLTMKSSAYGKSRADEDLEDRFPVYRATAVDAARHLSIRGRYPGLIALPDRWVSWVPHAMWLARKAIRIHRPDAIVSTYPIATAHLIGLLVHRLSGLPWVADFRDPMVDETYPKERSTRMIRSWIERQTIEQCAVSIFTSPGTHELYCERYPTKAPESMTTIFNGYDENDFIRAQSGGRVDSDLRCGPLKLVHSGVLYPDIRNPAAFFQALARLKESKEVTADRLRVVLRAPGSIEYYQSELRRYQIEDIVELKPAIPYSAALDEMLKADSLLLFQGSDANRQIPTKLFEYMRAQRTILAMTDERGDTARLMRSHNVGTVVEMTDPNAIAEALRNVLRSPRSTLSLPMAEVGRYSRQTAAMLLAARLNDLL